MGSSQSSEMKSVIESAVSASITVLNTNISNTNIVCEARNNMNLEFTEGSRVNIKKGSINIGQKASVVVCDLKSAVTNTTSNDFETKVKNELLTKLESLQDNKTGFLATGFSDQQSSAEIKASIKVAINKTFDNKNISNCAASATATNNGVILIKGIIDIEDGDLNITQESLVKATASCIVKSIISNIDKTTLDNIIKSDLKVSQKNVNDGLFDGLATLFGSLAVPLIIGCIVLFLIMSGGLGIYLYIQQSQQQSEE
jgi:hypothetical protein